MARARWGGWYPPTEQLTGSFADSDQFGDSGEVVVVVLGDEEGEVYGAHRGF